MKILLVSTQDYIHHPIPSRHHYIFEELAKRHEIHVPHFHVSRGKERETRLIVHEATMFPIKDPMLHYILNVPYQYTVFKRIIKNEKIDIVVASHIFAGAAVIHAAKKYGVPVVFDLKDWFPDSAAMYYKNKTIKWILREGVWKILKYNLDRSDMITTVSPSLEEKLKKHGYKSKLIINGVNTEYFNLMDPKEGKKLLGLNENSFVIGYVGALEGWIDLGTVVRGLSDLLHTEKNIYLVIIGGSLFTDYENNLKDIIKAEKLQDYVKFFGIIDYINLPKYIAGMDVCLIPFKKTPITDISLPNKFFEYSACGKPILSTPIPDVMKIGAENLYIYRNKDEFVDKVKYIMENQREFKIDIEKYSWKRKAEELEILLEDVMAFKKREPFILAGEFFKMIKKNERDTKK